MGKRLYREYDENGTLIKLECCKCGEIKSVDNFYKCKSKKDGYDNKCIKCQMKNRNRKHLLYRMYDENGTLIKLECCKCGEIKTVDNFNKCNSKKDGYNTICKKCTKKYSSNHYIDNKDKILKQTHKYHQENREKILERQRQYDKNNREKRREYHHQHYRENKEKISEYKKRYNLENKEKLIEYRQQYHQENREKILERQRQYRENNREKIHEHQRQHYQENREKISEYHKQHYLENKEKISKRHQKWYENKIDEEIKRIYENVTKNLYPNNGIQYGIIYGVHCKVTDRWYIGQTTNSFDIRYNGDFFTYKLQGLSEDNPKAQLLQDDIEKYGQENFEIIEVIDVAFSEKELDEKECYYIDYHKAYDEGYNSYRGNIFKHNKSKRKDVI